ncbi:MAG: peptide deformylase [Bacillota bacterium]|nr:peptide deformylase [Bacillota bacterium]
MAVRPTVQIGNPILRQVAAPVEDPAAPDIASLALDLSDTLADWRRRTGYGRGIAAPQIGESKRVVFIRIPGEEPMVLINPEIVWSSQETFTVWDACLSYFTLFFQVERARRVRVRYTDSAGRPQLLEAQDDLAELLQHELEHLDGRLAIDLVTDSRSFCSVEEFEKRLSRAGAARPPA